MKCLDRLVQTENTAPPGLTVIVGDRREPQGTNRSAVTVTAVVGSAGVRVPEEDDTLTTLPGSLATVSDQLTYQSPLPLPLRSICLPPPFGVSTSVPPCGSSDSVPE